MTSIRLKFNSLVFNLFQKIGFHFTPVHFGSPIPDTRTLKDSLWTEQSEIIGLDLNEANQLKLLSTFSFKFMNEYQSFPQMRTDVAHQYYVNNGTFEAVDGEILYSMIRHFKPKKVLEIGSGNSTYLSAQAILKNTADCGNECELTSVEPYPNDVLRKGFPGLSQLIIKKVEDIPLSQFTNLEENDILFIDSSHTLKIGNDVQYELLDVVPRLKKGVIVHFHDILLPVEYPKEWVLNKHLFWNEQYFLQAFLAFNNTFEILWASHYMYLKHLQLLEDAFPSCKTHGWSGPGSFWIRRNC